jgi:inorganic pyrophosphatase
VEISSTTLPIGSITPVKVLGALAMVDDGELDWKLLTINEKDPLYNQLNDISDIEKILPGYISGLSSSICLDLTLTLDRL